MKGFTVDNGALELAEGVYFRGEGREAGEVGRWLKTGSARPSTPIAVCPIACKK